jgi:hypothetical protein
MQLITEIDRVLSDRPRVTHRETCLPPTSAEAAAASARWQRRGPLRRLVRIDGAEEEVS